MPDRSSDTGTSDNIKPRRKGNGAKKAQEGPRKPILRLDDGVREIAPVPATESVAPASAATAKIVVSTVKLIYVFRSDRAGFAIHINLAGTGV